MKNICPKTFCPKWRILKSKPGGQVERDAPIAVHRGRGRQHEREAEQGPNIRRRHCQAEQLNKNAGGASAGWGRFLKQNSAPEHSKSGQSMIVWV
jgi:hypothetical protein